MLDKLEDARQSPLVVLAVDMQLAPNFIKKNANQMPLLRVFKAFEDKWKDASIAGAALGGLRTDKIEISIGLDCKTDQLAHELQKEAYAALAKNLTSDFKDGFETEISVTIPTTPTSQPGRGGQPGFGGGAFGGRPPGFPGGSSMPPGFPGGGSMPPGFPGGKRGTGGDSEGPLVHLRASQCPILAVFLVLAAIVEAFLVSQASRALEVDKRTRKRRTRIQPSIFK